MDFNSILIGSENPEGLVEARHEAVRALPMVAFGLADRVGLGDGLAALRGHGHEPYAGRIIWNIETDDVKGDFERMKAAGAIVVAKPNWIDPGDDAAIRPRLSRPSPTRTGNDFQLISLIDVTIACEVRFERCVSSTGEYDGGPR